MRSEANRESKDVRNSNVARRGGEIIFRDKIIPCMGVAWLATCGISFTPIPFLPVTSMESCEKNGVLRRVSIAAAVCEA
mgnify:CR=1 FL=1